MHDVIIIGSGPAGLTAAIYTSRAFLSTLVLTGMEPGGQLTTTTQVDNFPGFPDGIMGPKLMADMKTQAERFGTEIVSDVITNMQILPISNTTNTTNKTISKRTNFIVTGQKESYQGKSVIIATGASAQYLGLPSEKRLLGKGVSACATCDGFFFRGKEVVVAGGGDTAMEEANFLTTFATRVTVVHRREEFRASPIMLERAKNNPKIVFLTNKIIQEVIGDDHVEGLRLKDMKTGEESTLSCQGLFLAIGHTPNTTFCKDTIEVDEKGYIVTYGRLAHEHLAGTRNVDDEKLTRIRTASSLFTTHTSIRGIFAAGDCVDPLYRQAAVAAGQGTMAALDVQKWLSEQ